MAQNNNKIDLQKLGFSEHDAEIYLTLVELGTVTANPLISKTGLHRSVVYTSLDRLISRKLVEVKDVKGKKTFTVISPALLVEEFEEKRIIAEKVSNNVLARMKIEPQEITIHQGNDEYLALLSSCIKSMPKGSTKYVLGTGGEDFMELTMLPLWKKYHRVAHDQKINIKMIGYGQQRKSIEPHTSKEGIYEVKYLPSEMENPAGVHIYPEIGVVLSIIYSNKITPVTAIKIKNEALVQGYLNLFENLWKLDK